MDRGVLRTVWTQTALNTVTNAAAQTRSTSAATVPSFLVPCSGGVADALLAVPRRANDTESVLELVGDDVVVDYTDDVRPTADHPSSASYGEDEEDGGVLSDNEIVSFGHGRVVSIPRRRTNRSCSTSGSPSPLRRRSSPAISLDRAGDSQHAVPSHVDSDETARTTARLQRSLEDLRTASTLREKELNSIVENCRTAIRGEFVREWTSKEASYNKQIQDLERTVQQLKDVLVKRDETIREKQLLLSQQADIVDEAKRERDRHWMVVEGQLKSEVARLQRDKEKMRFDVEVAQNRTATVASAVQMTTARAEASERMWERELLRNVQVSEEMLRHAIEERATDVLVGIVHAASQVQRLDDYHTIRSEERWERIQSMLEPALQYNGEEGLARLVATAPRRPSTDPLVDQDLITTVAEVTIHELIHKRATEWCNLQASWERDAAARDALLGELHDRVALYKQQMEEFQTASNERLAQMAQRCATSEAVLAASAAKISSGALRRARSKATGDVLDDLVREHELAMAQTTMDLKKTREELEEAKRLNMVEEALALRGTVAALESDRNGLARTVATVQAQLRTLEAASRDMASGVTESRARQQEISSQLEQALSRLAAAEQLHHDESIAQRKRVEELEAACKRGQLQLQDALDEQRMIQLRCESLVQQNNSLKDKFVADKTEEVVARVNRKLVADLPQKGDSRSAPTTAHQPAPEVERLQQKVLMLRRENDALVQRLDSALAEASHAEEHRQHALERTLSMMAQDDAAPKREQLLMAQRAELEGYAKQLGERESILAHRALELERRESLLGRHGAMPPSVASAPRHTKQIGPVTPRQQATASADSERNAAVGKNTNVRLAPISLRPVAASAPSDRSDMNPQKYVLPLA